jgi:isocitrate lyase
MALTREQQIAALEKDWAENPRWKGVTRTYTAADVVRLRGSVQPEHTFAKRAPKSCGTWSPKVPPSFRPEKDFVNCMGALTGGQAVQQVKAGIQAIYLSGWQVAADNNSAESMYPDQSLYPVDSVPTVVKRINNSFRRADQIQWKAGKNPGDEGYIDYFAPIVADAEAGFGGVLNAYELMKNMIEAGAAGVHFEDQLASVKNAATWAARYWYRPRKPYRSWWLPAWPLTCRRTDHHPGPYRRQRRRPADQRLRPVRPAVRDWRAYPEGFYKVRAGLDQAIARGLAYAPYADLIWCETAKPDLDEARRFAEAIKKEYPDQMLSYNCSPSFNWKKNLDDATIAKFQRELSAMGYKHQFITLAGIHNMWHGMFNLAHDYARNDMTAYVKLQEQEFADASKGYTFVAHQQEVGTGYFDDMTTVIQGGASSVTALTGSTEEEQFH